VKTVGQILKEERTKKNLTLEEIEHATKIRKKILLSLENGDWKSLPSTTFVKGLIKNYGRFLGLDHNELIAFYRREFDEKKETKKIIQPGKVKTHGFRLTPQMVTASVISIAVLLVVGYLFIQYQSFTGPPLLEITSPQDNIKVNNNEVTLVGKTWEDSVLKVNGETVQLSPGGTFSLPVGLNPGVNIITVTSANRFGKISTVKRTVVVEMAKKIENVTADTGVTIVIKISPDSANLLVEIDGKKDFEGILLSGTEKTFTAKERIRVITKNAGSTNITYLGTAETLGKSGDEAEKIYQKSAQ
jgi:cytoskeletal protein RodZ